jgi:predicted transposase YbfD/YdcC
MRRGKAKQKLRLKWTNGVGTGGPKVRPRVDWMKSFEGLKDPRREQGTYHPLKSLIGVGILAVLCGAASWDKVVSYGEEKESWLREFLELPCGIPSADTFERVFSRLDPVAFEAGFRDWINQLLESLEVKVIAIDGKSHRGSYDRGTKLKALHTVSAWSSEHRLVLGEVAVSQKSNEITAIPQLLEMLTIEGAVITMDAMGTQKEIARQIRTKKADYILSLKGNHSKLHQAVDAWVTSAKAKAWQGIEHQTTASMEDGHHRHEQRQLWAIPISVLQDDPVLQAELALWDGCQTLVVVWRRRELWNKTTVETQFYLTSLPPEPTQLLKQIRSHWSIESQMHWCLDIVFGEDDSRIRKGFSSRNFGILRRLALCLLNQEKTYKASLSRKRFKALCNERYLCSILHAGLP